MAFDLKDLRCMEASCTDSADGAVMFAAGVLYYFATKEAKSLGHRHRKTIPPRAAGLCCSRTNSRPADAENLDETDGHSECGRFPYRTPTPQSPECFEAVHQGQHGSFGPILYGEDGTSLSQR